MPRAALRRRPICMNASSTARGRCARTRRSRRSTCRRQRRCRPATASCNRNMPKRSRYIAHHGEAALYHGPLGDILVDYMKAHGGFITHKDLTSYKTVERSPIRADYRGWEILGPPPPAASGVHIAQMLNILEGYDIARKRVRHRRDDPSAGRSAEDRVCRSRRRQRRSGVYRCAGGAADLQGLRR